MGDLEANDIVTSAILIACEEGNLDALEQLVNIHRLDLNVTNALQEGPLHCACGSGHEKVVAYLQRRGLPMDAEDGRGDTPLFWAARNGHANLIRYMTMGKNRLADVNKQNKSLETSLHTSIRYLQTEAVLALLESGADVNIQDEHGESGSHIAAWHNSPLLLSILCRFNPILTLTNKSFFCSSRLHTPFQKLTHTGKSVIVTHFSKLESRPLTALTTKDGQLTARDSNKQEGFDFTLVDHQFHDSDLSSNLPSSDEEEIRNSTRPSEEATPGFPSEIFIPSTTDSTTDSIIDSAINTASTIDSDNLPILLDESPPSSNLKERTDEVLNRLLADPQQIAAIEFSQLVTKLTTSLHQVKLEIDEFPTRRASRAEPITNPFHPLYPSSNNKAKKPILPLEGGNENFVDETTLRPLIPRLDALHVSSLDIKRPSDVLVGLSQHNPFRLEAWNDHESDHQLASTARPYNGTKTHENLQIRHFDSTTNGNGYVGEDEQDNGEEHLKKGEYDENEFEVECPVRLSSSLPNSTRRPAPCAISYPSTSVFIRLVNSAFDAGLPPSSKFYLDGCCTDSETSLHIAATRGHLECVQSLLEAGAPLDARDQAGQTALHMALRRSHTEIALLLITKGCNFDLADENGDTPLIISCRLGLVNNVQTLCHIGAVVDFQNNKSMSGLHCAALEGHLEVVRCLCLSGADVNLKTKDEQTAEMLAFQNGHELVGNLLSKMKSENFRDQSIEQLCLLDVPLRRIKLKLFGHSDVGKSRLVQSLQSGGMISSLVEAVSRRFSDNLNTSNATNEKAKRMSDEGIHSCSSSTSSESANNAIEKQKTWVGNFRRPVHPNYTNGIDVLNVNFPGCGEFSCWEFGGYEPYHVLYDHFVGNTDCIHVIVISCLDPTEVQYKEVLYWINFLKGRVTPSEPISHCGVVSRLSKVVVIGTHATSAQFPGRDSNGEYINSDVDAMLKTIRLRFETHFDIHDRLILLDSTNGSCPGMKSLRQYLHKARDSIVARLQKPLALLDNCVNFLGTLRKRYANFPVITWPHFTNVIRNDVNPLTSDSHCRQLIQQLQLIGEVVYLRDEASELDYVVLTPEWLGTHVLGTLLSAQFLMSCRPDGCYTLDQFAPIFPEIAETEHLVHMLDTLQLCSPIDDSRFEFPAFVFTEAPKDLWLRNKPNYVYGGLRILPMRGMERSLQSTFVRLQVALRRSMNDFADPMDADLQQYLECSKISSGKMESLIRLQGDAVEIQVRGPSELASSCVYFLEDIANLVEQTCNEVAPGISLERHFLSPQHLREHRLQPASFPPEEIMAMQQRESLTIRNTDGEDELFTNVVCFGSREVAAVLTLGVDVSVSQLQLTARCELAALLDPPDKMGRDWSILAVKLNLTDQLPEVDSTGQSLSRTDQLLAEWALQAPESASIGRLCSILEEMGRADARDLLFRTVPLYLFATLDDQHANENGH